MYLIENSGLMMSSLDFLNAVINPAREAAGESVLRNTELVRKIQDELDLTVADFLQATAPQGGTPQSYIILDQDQMMLIGMRESKAVRKSVMRKLKELTNQNDAQQKLPRTYKDALLALVAAEEEKEQLAHERDEAERTKAHISGKKAATAMNTASQLSKKNKKLESEVIQLEDRLQDVGTYKSIKGAGLPLDIMLDGATRKSWMILKALSEKLGRDITKIDDPNFGTVNGYHNDVIDEFKALFNIV